MMPFTQPKLKSNEFLSLLQEAALESFQDELFVRRRRAEADQIKKITPATGHMLHGVIDTYLWKTESADKNFQTAIDLDPGTASISVNYMKSLAFLGAWDRCRQIAMEVPNSFPGDIAALRIAITRLVESGYISKAKEMLSVWDKYSPEEEHVHEQILDELIDFYQSKGIDESLMLSALDIVRVVLQDKKIHFHGIRPIIQCDGSSYWLLYEILVKDVGVEEIIDIEDQIIHEVIEQLDSPILDKYLVFGLIDSSCQLESDE